MAISETQPSTMRGQARWTKGVRSLLDRYAQNRKKRRALAELRGLGARTLKDLAIDRSEISSVVHGNSHGRRRPHSRD